MYCPTWAAIVLDYSENCFSELIEICSLNSSLNLLDSLLGFGLLRRSTDYIHVVVRGNDELMGQQ